jgi:hypothetical protein
MVQNDNTKEAAFRPYLPVRTGARGWGTHYPPEISRTGVDCFSSSDAPPPTTVQSLRPFQHQSLVSYLDQGTAVHCRGRPSRRDKQSLNGVDPSAARLAPARSCPHSGQIVTPAEDTEPFPISIPQDEGLILASRLLGWGGTAGYKGFPSDRWSGITCVCLISRVEHTLETGPLKNHTQGHLRYASSLVQSLRHKRTRRTAGGNQAEVISEARCTEREEHPPVHAQRASIMTLPT